MAKGYGKRLLEVREMLGLTQKEMSEHLGASFRSYQSYEREEGAPKISHLMVLQRSNVSIDWLLSGEGHMMLQQAGETGPTRLSDVNVGILKLVVECVLEEMEGPTGQPYSPALASHVAAVLYRQLHEQVDRAKGRRVPEESIRRNVEDLMSVLELAGQLESRDFHGKDEKATTRIGNKKL